MPPLLTIPNFSEGRDPATIDALRVAAAAHAQLLDVQSDPDHHRSVLTLSGSPGSLHRAVIAAARVAVDRIDISDHHGVHPRVGAIDVAPIVYLTPADRGPAMAEALVLADALGNLDLPVYLYGALAQGRSRAELRRGGPGELITRSPPDFGPHRLHPTAGAVLVAARPPLVAFNLDLGPGVDLQSARGIAARIREGGDEGLAGVRAIGLWLRSRGCAQVSTNVEDHLATPLGAIVEAVRRHARIQGAELIGLAPAAAFQGFPEDVPVRNRRTVEEALRG